MINISKKKLSFSLCHSLDMYRFTKKLNPAGSSTYGGNFVHDKARGTINGKPVYVNKERGIFLASHPNNSGWHIVSLYYWDEVSTKQGPFCSVCHGNTPTPQTGYGDKVWRDYLIEYQRPRSQAASQSQATPRSQAAPKQGKCKKYSDKRKKIEFDIPR